MLAGYDAHLFIRELAKYTTGMSVIAKIQKTTFPSQQSLTSIKKETKERRKWN